MLNKLQLMYPQGKLKLNGHSVQ